MARPDPRPLRVTPRLLRRELAAEYCGLSPRKFDEAVREALLPPAKMLGTVHGWDRHELDAAIDELPERGTANTWDDLQ
jgi:predicted DNA-binding transcriptional regulator AlpA